MVDVVGCSRAALVVAALVWLLVGCADKSDGDDGGARSCEEILSRGPCEAAGCRSFIAGSFELELVAGQCSSTAIDAESADAPGLCSSEVVGQQGAPGTLVYGPSGLTLSFSGVPAGAGLGDWSPCGCDEATACGCADHCQPEPPATSTGAASSTGAATGSGG